MVAPAREVREAEGRIVVLAGKECAPRWTMPMAERMAEKPCADTPGLAYNCHRSIDKRRPRGPNFGPKNRQRSAPRLTTLASESPGPNYYPPEVELRRPGGAMSVYPPPRPGQTPEDTPGPGAYAVARSTLHRGGAVYMGDPRCRRPESAPPGPALLGNASVAGRGAPKFSFGTGRRAVGEAAADAGGRRGDSGPSLYMPPSTLGGGAASCKAGAVPPDAKRFELRPDPGAYMLPQRRVQGPGTFARSKRPVSAPAGTRKDSIGPGSYSLVDRLDTCGQGVSFAASKRPDRANKVAAEVPGPGEYRVGGGCGGQAVSFPQAVRLLGPSADSAASASHATLLEKVAAQVAAEAAAARSAFSAPAPGTLDTRGPKLPPRLDPQVPLQRTKSLPVPGPGAFDVKVPWRRQGCVFGSGPRQPRSLAGGAGPGPGQYHVDFRAGQANAGVSFKGGAIEPLERAPEPTPGPSRAYGSFG